MLVCLLENHFSQEYIAASCWFVWCISFMYEF